jgi:hypothetical protein
VCHCLERRVAEGVAQRSRVRHWVVRRQLRDDHVEHARLRGNKTTCARQRATDAAGESAGWPVFGCQIGTKCPILHAK